VVFEHKLYCHCSVHWLCWNDVLTKYYSEIYRRNTDEKIQNKDN